MQYEQGDKRYTVDDDTGELLSTRTLRHVWTLDGETAIPVKTGRRRKQRRYVKLYVSDMDDIVGKLSNTEFGVLAWMALHVGYQDQRVFMPDGQLATLHDITVAAGLSKRQSIRVMQRLQDIGAVQCQRDGRTNTYTVSARYAEKGKTRTQ